MKESTVFDWKAQQNSPNRKTNPTSGKYNSIEHQNIHNRKRRKENKIPPSSENLNGWRRNGDNFSLSRKEHLHYYLNYKNNWIDYLI